MFQMSYSFDNLLIYLRKHKLLVAISYSLMLIGIAVLFLPFRFEENDDVVMLLLASGNYTGNFESNLVFINPIYGGLVTFLYKSIKGVEWYTLLFLLFHLLSLSIVTYKTLNFNIPSFFKGVLLLFFSVVSINFVMYLQFTTVALMLCLSAILMILNSNKRISMFLGVGLIILSSLIRAEIVLLMLAASIPYLMFTFLKVKKFKKALFSILLLIIPLVSIQLRDEILISNEWKEATKYNRLRAEVTDNINADYSSENYKAICNLADYTLLKNFFIAPEYFNSQKLELLKLKIQGNQTKWSKLNNIPLQLKSYLKEFIFLGVMLIILFLANPKRKEVYTMLIYGGFLFVLISYLSLDGLLKNRVFMGFVLIFVLVMVHNLTQNLVVKKTYFISFSILMLVFSFYYLRRLNEKIQETNQIRNGYLAEQIHFIDDFFLKSAESILIPFGDDLKIQYLNPFKISSTTDRWRIFYLGWMTNNPYNKKFEKRLKTNFSVFKTIYNSQKYSASFKASNYFGNFTVNDSFKSGGFSIQEFKK